MWNLKKVVDLFTWKKSFFSDKIFQLWFCGNEQTVHYFYFFLIQWKSHFDKQAFYPLWLHTWIQLTKDFFRFSSLTKMSTDVFFCRISSLVMCFRIFVHVLHIWAFIQFFHNPPFVGSFSVVEIRIIILLKETDASQVIDWQFH